MNGKYLNLIIILSFLTACSDPDYPAAVPATSPSTATANVRIVHTIPDAGDLDISVENEIFVTDLGYLEDSDYETLPAGIRQVRVFLDDASIRTANSAYRLGSSYTFFVINLAGATKSTTVVTSDNLTSPPTDTAYVRFLHFSPDAPEVRVTTSDGDTEVFQKRKFAATSTGSGSSLVDFTKFSKIAAGTYDLEVRGGDPEEVFLPIDGVTFEAGKIYTVYARGLVTSPPAGKELGASIIMHN